MLGVARPSMRKITQHSVVRNLHMGDSKICTERDRERECVCVCVWHKEFFFIHADATVTYKNNNNLLKVTKSLYRVTNLGQLPFMLFT